MSTTEQLQAAGDDEFLMHFLPGSSEQALKLRRDVARLNTPLGRSLASAVLITGETGAGKNHLARVIAAHARWLDLRNTGGFLGLGAGLKHLSDRLAEINLPGIPEMLAESTLFGHRKGAFTGAVRDHEGYFAEDYSDILLDEIGDASLALQAKLLRVIETGRFRPVGGTQQDEGSTGARILAATNRPLVDLVKGAQFRCDLLWRISEFSIQVPPLRQRRECIPAILQSIVAELNAVAPTETRLSPDDIRWAAGYAWPGNIRQMRHAVKRWRLESGGVAFSDAAEDCWGELMAAGAGPTVNPIAEHISRQLDLALGGQQVTQLSALVDEAAREAKRAIVQWYDSHRPTADDLDHMFTDAQPRSVQNKIAKWRKEL